MREFVVVHYVHERLRDKLQWVEIQRLMVYRRADGSRYIIAATLDHKKVRMDIQGPAPYSVKILVGDDNW